MGARSDCQVCAHPRVAEIHAKRASQPPVPLRRLEAEYGVTKSAIHIHYQEAHPGTPNAARAGKGSTPAAGWDGLTTLERLERVRDALQARIDTGGYRTDEARELRMVLGEIAKLQGEDRPQVVTVHDVEGLPELLTEMARALEPFPEARLALQDAVSRWEKRFPAPVSTGGTTS